MQSSIQGLNLSLDQHLPPNPRSVPSTSGGFLKYPSKIRSLREPADISKTSGAAGPSTRLITELGLSRGQSPGEGRRVRESLEKIAFDKPSATSIIFDPTSSQIVQHFQSKASKRLADSPSLIGGDGFAQSLQRRNIDALAYARMRRASVEVATDPQFTKLDLSDLADYQRWSKGSCEPFIKDLRAAILANRPENIPEFVAAYCCAMVMGQPQPRAYLPGEREASLSAFLQKEDQNEDEEPAAAAAT